MKTKIEFQRLLQVCPLCFFLNTRSDDNKQTVGDRINGQGPVPDIDLGEAHDSDDDDNGGGGGGGGRRGGSRGRGRGVTRARGVPRGGGASTRGSTTARPSRGRGRGAASAPAHQLPPPPPPPPAAPQAALTGNDSDDCACILRFAWMCSGSEDAPDWSDSPPPPPAPAPRVATPRPLVSRNAPPSNSSGVGPQCDCGIPAAERTVTKETANKGRKFWTCGNSQTCEFFQWYDGPSGSSTSNFASTSRSASSNGTLPTVPSKRPFSSVSAGANGGVGAGGERRCQCDLTAVLKETATGANKGRKYWSCPNQSRQAQCRFFEWAGDGEDANVESRSGPAFSGVRRAPRSYGGSGGAGGAGGSSGGCFVCGEDGHWANGRI